MHVILGGGGVGACSPRKILVFERSETICSAFSGMMNSICEKLYYAYSQNNIQHILTCKSTISVLVFRQPGPRNRKWTVACLSPSDLLYY